MLCPRCGEENHDSRSTCWHCRAPLTGQATRAEAPLGSPTPSKVHRRKAQQDLSDGEKVGLLAASVLLPLAGLIWGIIYACSAEPAKKKWGGYAIAASGSCMVIGFIGIMIFAGALGEVATAPSSTGSGEGSGSGRSIGLPVASRSDPASQIQMLNWDFETEVVSWELGIIHQYIEGNARNNSDRTIGYAQVEFNLYDSSNRLIGTSFDNIANWEPGSTWHFKTIILEENVSSGKFKGFTAY